ncbi:hypothetical protein BJ742DRAFT_338681 [Cladochytrium replicatum]|nr:hypothetical protein BJ742DRAFT_338681 [Cladochytrium replicatum]
MPKRSRYGGPAEPPKSSQWEVSAAVEPQNQFDGSTRGWKIIHRPTTSIEDVLALSDDEEQVRGETQLLNDIQLSAIPAWKKKRRRTCGPDQILESPVSVVSSPAVENTMFLSPLPKSARKMIQTPRTTFTKDISDELKVLEGIMKTRREEDEKLVELLQQRQRENHELERVYQSLSKLARKNGLSNLGASPLRSALTRRTTDALRTLDRTDKLSTATNTPKGSRSPTVRFSKKVEEISIEPVPPLHSKAVENEEARKEESSDDTASSGEEDESFKNNEGPFGMLKWLFPWTK